MIKVIDEKLVKIVYRELGESCSKLFVDFYHGFSIEEQIQGVKEILKLAVGSDRTSEILKDYIKTSNNYDLG